MIASAEFRLRFAKDSMHCTGPSCPRSHKGAQNGRPIQFDHDLDRRFASDTMQSRSPFLSDANLIPRILPSFCLAQGPEMAKRPCLLFALLVLGAISAPGCREAAHSSASSSGDSSTASDSGITGAKV